MRACDYVSVLGKKWTRFSFGINFGHPSFVLSIVRKQIVIASLKVQFFICKIPFFLGEPPKIQFGAKQSGTEATHETTRYSTRPTEYPTSRLQWTKSHSLSEVTEFHVFRRSSGQPQGSDFLSKDHEQYTKTLVIKSEIWATTQRFWCLGRSKSQVSSKRS